MQQPYGPLLEVARIQSEINRLFDNLLDLGAPTKQAGAWLPGTDVVETDEHLLVRVDMPGVDPGNLEVAVHGGNVILKGDKPRPATGEGARFRAAERAFGRFRRVIQLGVPVNTHHAEAVLTDGTLTLRFPKVPNRRGEERAIQVRTS
jgi:HSP20 family protein